MAKDLILDVVARKNSRDLTLLAAEFQKLAAEADASGKSMQRTGTFAGLLDSEIAKTKEAVKELGDEFNRTGNVDVFAKLRGTQANLKSLERIKKDLAQQVEQGIELGAVGGFTQGAVKGIPLIGEKIVETLPPEVSAGIGAALIAAAAVAAPTVVAAIGGAVGTGLGLGLIGGGIAGAIQDPSVKGALTNLKGDLKTTFTESTAAFVEPTRQAIDQFDEFAVRIEPKLEAAFGPLAKAVPGLEKAAEGFIDNFLTGLDKIDFTPFIRLAEDELPKMGEAAGQFVKEVSNPDTAQALRTVLDISVKIVDVMGGTIDLMGKIASHTSDFMAPVAKGIAALNPADDKASALKRLDTAVSDAGTAAADAAPDFASLSKELSKTQVTADTLAGTMTDKLFDALMNEDQAVLGVAESHTQLSKALDENGRALDINSEKGDANREAVLSVVEANRRQYDAMIASGDSAKDAAAQYDANTQALQRQLEKAGFTAQQIDGLIGKYRNIPDMVNTTIATQGLTESVNDLSDLLRYLNGLQGQHYHFSVDATYRQDTQSTYNSQVPSFVPSSAGGGGTGRTRAAGGPVYAGMLYRVNEQGPEMFVPSANGYIMPNKMLGGSRGASSGGSTLRVADGADGAVATLIRTLVNNGLLALN